MEWVCIHIFPAMLRLGESLNRVPGSAVSVSGLGPLALLGSGVSSPRAVVLRAWMAVDTWVLLADSVVLVAMTSPGDGGRNMHLFVFRHISFEAEIEPWQAEPTSIRRPVGYRTLELPWAIRGPRPGQSCGWTSQASAARSKGWGSAESLLASPAVCAYMKKRNWM